MQNTQILTKLHEGVKGRKGFEVHLFSCRARTTRLFALQNFQRMLSKYAKIINGEANGYFLILCKQRAGAIILKHLC